MSQTGYYLVNVTKGETKMGLCIKAIKNLSSYRMSAFVKTIQGGYTFVDHKRISRKKFDELRNFKKEKS